MTYLAQTKKLYRFIEKMGISEIFKKLQLFSSKKGRVVQKFSLFSLEKGWVGGKCMTFFLNHHCVGNSDFGLPMILRLISSFNEIINQEIIHFISLFFTYLRTLIL